MLGVFLFANLYSDAGVPATAVLPYPALPYGLAGPAELFLHMHPADTGQNQVAVVHPHRPYAVIYAEAEAAVPAKEARAAVLAPVVPFYGVHRVDHPALDGVLAQLPEPGVGCVLDPVDLGPEFHRLEAKAPEPLSLLPPESNEVVAGDPGRRRMAAESRFLAVAGLQFYYLGDEHGYNLQEVPGCLTSISAPLG